MNAPLRCVSSCVIEVDVLHSQTAFYDVKTYVLHLRGKSYKGVYIKHVGGGAGGFYKFFQKKVRSPGDHRPTYLMGQ